MKVALRSAGLVGMAVLQFGCRTGPDPDAIGPAMTATTLGRVYLQEGRLPEAEVEFMKVITLLPRAASGYGHLAQVYLRGSRFEDAERQILKAIERDSAEVSWHLLLARTYQRTGRADEARGTLEARLRAASDDARIAYGLVALSRSVAESTEYLRRTILAAPTSLAPRVELALALARQGQADAAVAELEELRKGWAEPPAEARQAFDTALGMLQSGQTGPGLRSLEQLQRSLELTPPYQASLLSLGGGNGPVAGYPILSFSPVLSMPGQTGPSPVAPRFLEATAQSGLPGGSGAGGSAALAIGDQEGDGNDDLMVGGRLYRNSGSGFEDVTEQVGLPGDPAITTSAMADVDNDGHLDLFLSGPGGSRLLRGSPQGRFRDVTRATGFGSTVGIRAAVFVDVDHDGDLDLLLLTRDGPRLWRNNLDGSFTDTTVPMGLAGDPGAASAAFGDFDDDGRIDLVLAGEGPVALYLNRGQSRFENVAQAAGLPGDRPSRAVAVGDYDNDGTLDLALGGPGGLSLWRNSGSGTFSEDRAGAALVSLTRSGPGTIGFLDYDNDGRLDLVAASAGREDPGQNLALFRGEPNGMSDQSSALPSELPPIVRLLVADLDQDGDEDLVVAGTDGSVHLLRNDGGNANPYVRVQLSALRTASGKNNSFGIGARLELRAGDLYQSRVVTGRLTHFGLGGHDAADALRIQWPNGVPQILAAGATGEVREAEVLKGSCAFAYAWDGQQFQLVSDVMWKSALGMPTGIMGSTTAYAPPGASTEYIRIPGTALAPRDGRYLLQLTEELWETAYLDQVRLLVVDHPDSVEVFVNERFVPPGPTPLRVHQAIRPRPPVSARDGEGNDLLPLLVARDDRYVGGMAPTRYQGITEPHELILDLGDLAGLDSVFLYLNGWIYPSDASINVAVAQASALRVQPPTLEVRNGRGEWITAVADLGFPAGKRKTVIADLTGRFPTRDHRVRIRTNMQIYWDQAFVAGSATRSPLTVTTLDPVTADLHFRGFSRTYRRGGRYGPQWFDYSEVSTVSPWRPIVGAFTRYGEVLPLLRAADDRYVVMAPGDETTIGFDVHQVPELPPGWRRDFLLYTDGWIKDSDLNTATGTAVDPLPFHAMTRYPYGEEQSYPMTRVHRDYLRTYQTRRVGPGR